MKRIVSKLLSKFGYKLVKLTPSKQKTNVVIQKRPLYVEFIGIPGVGKSTLYNQCQKATTDWVDRFFYLNNIHKTSNNETTLALYNQLADLKLENLLKSKYSGMDKLKLARYFRSILRDDKKILMNEKYLITADEGVLHNFGEELEQWYGKSQNQSQINSFIKNRTLIYCYAPSDVIVKRILKRKNETGGLLPQYKVNTESELEDVVERAILDKENVIQFLDSLSIPILKINTTDDLNYCVEKVINFVKSQHNEN